MSISTGCAMWRARRDRRAGRGTAGGRNSRKARQLSGLHPPLGQRSITEFNYRFAHGATAKIFVGVKLTRGDAEKHEIICCCRTMASRVIDLTDNEVAKLHVRYMVAGGERPDRRSGLPLPVPRTPGRPAQILEGLNDEWNISLFTTAITAPITDGCWSACRCHKRHVRIFIAHIDAVGFPIGRDPTRPIGSFRSRAQRLTGTVTTLLPRYDAINRQ